MSHKHRASRPRMVRKYTVTAFTEAEDTLASLPPELASVAQQYPLAGLQAYAWTFGEDSFDRIPRLRDALKVQSPRIIEETGRRAYSEADSKRADLLLLTGGELSDGEVVENHSREHRRCAHCGFVVVQVRKNPKLLVRLPDEPLPGIFWLRGADLVIASEPAWRKLEQARLTNGLSTFDVRTTAPCDERYLGLYSNAALGWPAAPFGYTGTHCAKCGRPVRRSLDAADRRVYPGLPRYSFYLVFEHPCEHADWMWTEVHGQTSLIVSGAVRDWFAKNDETVIGSSSSRANEFHFLAMGWFPDEAGSAFLPEPYHEPPAPGSGSAGGIALARAAVERFLGDSSSEKASNQSSAASPANPATRMFAAWSGQDPQRVGRDPQALLAGLRAVGEDVREIMRDAVSGDPARHARAEARLAELKRLQAEAGLAGEASPEAVAPGSGADPDSPGARFRGRLQTILEEAVGRLERLKTEVEGARSGPKSASDDEAAPRTGEDEGEKRS